MTKKEEKPIPMLTLDEVVNPLKVVEKVVNWKTPDGKVVQRKVKVKKLRVGEIRKATKKSEGDPSMFIEWMLSYAIQEPKFVPQILDDLDPENLNELVRVMNEVNQTSGLEEKARNF